MRLAIGVIGKAVALCVAAFLEVGGAVTSPDELSPRHQQVLNQIDAHGAAQVEDPPPAPIAFALWACFLTAWAGIFWALGYVLGAMQ